MWVEAVDVFVERVDEDPERQVELELTGTAREDEVPPRVCAGGELGEEARLADPWFADELERRGMPPSIWVRRRSTESSSDARPTRWVASVICRFRAPP